MAGGYWRRVHNRAAGEALHLLGLGSWSQIVIRAAVVIAAILALMFWGSTDAASDEMIVRVAIVAVIVLLFPLVYVWKFVRSPAAIEKELIDIHKQRVGALESTINSLGVQAVNIRAATLTASSLSILIERGWDLSMRRITVDELPNWIQEVNAWNLNCMALLRTGISHQDAVSFKTVIYDPQRDIVYKVNEDHNNLLNALFARIELLQGISTRYKAYWLTITPQWRAVVEDHLTKFKGD